jgi:RNA polymerase sigma-54 factor
MEDKSKPLSDDRLTKLMNQSGFPIARRTVAKYREAMKISKATLRRKILL